MDLKKFNAESSHLLLSMERIEPLQNQKPLQIAKPQIQE